MKSFSFVLKFKLMVKRTEEIHLTEQLLDHATEMIILCDKKSIVRYANVAALSFFKTCIPGNELVLPLVDPLTKIVDGIPEGVKKVDSDNGTVFLRCLTKTINRAGEQLLFHSFIDITEEQAAINLLEEKEHTLRNLIDVVPHAIFLKDGERRFKIINQAVCSHHNLKKADMLGKRDEDFFGDDSVPFIKDEERILKTKEPLHIPEESFTDIHGELKVMETIKVPFFIQSSKEWGILGVAIDITQRKILQEQQTKLRLEHQKSLMNAVVDAQERERSKIANDLHDGLGQLLTAAKMNLNAVTTMKGYTENINLKKSEQLLENSIQEVRNITRSLVPGILNDFGLITALERLVDNCNATKRMKFTFSSHNIDESLLESHIQNNLYRVCQEIVNNALKYSKAEQVSIQLFGRDEELILQVEDDGVGFDLQKTLKENRGLGLKSIMNRVDLMSGDMDLDTSLGRGCEYSIIIDL